MSRGVTIMRALAEGRTPAPPTPREAKPLSKEEDKLLQEFQASQLAVIDTGAGSEEQHIASLLTTAAVPGRAPTPTPTESGPTCTTGSITNDIVPGLPPTMASLNFDTEEEEEEESTSAPFLASPQQYQFTQFMKVLYRPPDNTKQQPPLKGTIGQVLQSPSSSVSGPGRYIVALADKVVEVPGDCLSPDIAAGDVVWYASSSNNYIKEEAVVHRVDVSYWPPSYVVQLRGNGAFRDVSMYQLQLKGPESNNGGGGGGRRGEGGVTAHPVPASPPPPPPPPPPAAAPQAAAVVGYRPAMKVVVEAHKMTKQAASALSFEDVPTAVKLLSEALRLLTRPS
jgi:hypothetical protein